MKPRKPTVAEIVHPLDKHLVTRSQHDVREETGAEPLWAPLMGRNFDAFSLEGRNERWTRMSH